LKSGKAEDLEGWGLSFVNILEYHYFTIIQIYFLNRKQKKKKKKKKKKKRGHVVELTIFSVIPHYLN
jgi:hypothetical protein